MKWALIYVLASGIWDTGFRYSVYEDCIDQAVSIQAIIKPKLDKQNFGPRRTDSYIDWRCIASNDPSKSNVQQSQGAQNVVSMQFGGGTYTGEVSKGAPNGFGTFTDSEGRKFVGEWKDGQPVIDSSSGSN